MNHGITLLYGKLGIQPLTHIIKQTKSTSEHETFFVFEAFFLDFSDTFASSMKSYFYCRTNCAIIRVTATKLLTCVNMYLTCVDS
jgi:hypothetical protein